MNSEQRVDAVLELLEGKASVTELAQRHGVTESELLAWRDVWLAGARTASRARAPRRSFKVLGTVAAVAIVSLVSHEAWAASCATPSLFSSLGLTYFCANDPALASEVNNNTEQLVRLIQQKVGANWGPSDGGVSSVGITTPTVTVNGATTLTGGATIGPAGSLNFGNTTRQMLNLWGTNFGVGVQDNTLYFRSGGNFAWYVNGAHSTGELTAGGGTEVMRVTPGGGLAVRGRKQSDYTIANDRYEVQRLTVDATPTVNGYSLPIDQNELDALCRDDDGCHFTIGMVNFTGDGNVAVREGTLFLSQTTRAWRAFFAGTDFIGLDGSGGTTELSVWDCYFGDSAGTDFNNNRSDTAVGFSLLNVKGGTYSDTDTTCRIVFRD